MSCGSYDAMPAVPFAIELNRSSVFYDFLFPWACFETFSESIRIIAVRSDAFDDKKNGAILNNVCQKDDSGSDSRVILGWLNRRIAIGAKNGLSGDGDNVFV